LASGVILVPLVAALAVVAEDRPQSGYLFW
jgi:hypothetical protein